MVLKSGHFFSTFFQHFFVHFRLFVTIFSFLLNVFEKETCVWWAYDFQLITVMVVDDYDEGNPCGLAHLKPRIWKFSETFFTSIRERCGEVKTNVFMSDDANAYYNAWAAAFPQPS